MSVYVDQLINFNYNNEKTPRCFRNTPSCHMYADTLEELHEMALRIGMKKSWFQSAYSLPHYDLVTSKRKLAIIAGAVEHTSRQMVEFMQAKRNERVKS